MTKKVFIGVLAALMLFAFVACEPQQVEWPYTGEDAKDVINVTLADPSAIKVYAGEAFEAETYINIERLDDTVDQVIGTVTVANPVPGRNTATVSWGEGTQTGTGKLFVDAYSLTGALDVVIDSTKLVDEDEASIVEDADDVKAAITSVTAKYSDGKEKTISAGYEVKLDAKTGEVVVTYSNSKYTTEVLSYTTTVEMKPEAIEKTAVKKSEVTDLAIEWIVNDKVVGTDFEYKATVGDTVSYKIYGLASDMTNRTHLLLAVTTDYVVTSGSIKTTELQAADITGWQENEESEETKAFTATIQFVPNKEAGEDGKVDPNFGSVITKTLTMEVKDTLKKETVDTAVAAANFKYKVNKEGVESKVAVGKETQIVPSDFTTTVKTVGGVEITIQGYDKYGASVWTIKPESAASDLGDFTFTWKTTDDAYGHFEGVVTGVKVDAEAVSE